jgi:hypothetical protein
MFTTDAIVSLRAKVRNVEQYERHGGPYDRGSADSYYGRGIDPHYYVGSTGNSTRVAIEEGTEEYDAYMLGYMENENSQNFKDWG